MKSPTPTPPRREGAVPKNTVSQNQSKTALCASPSLRGRAGVGLLLCLILSGCITKYEPAGIEELADILVVEGIITDDETTITLTRSVNLSGVFTSDPGDPSLTYYVNNAEVYVECEDGTQFQAEPPDWWSSCLPRCDGRYKIMTGKLNPDKKYCLKIEIEEIDSDCYSGVGSGSCPAKTYKYSSISSYPIQTPEIDSVFWMKRGKGQPVSIHVATHSPDLKVLYYRWSYREDWEIRSKFYTNKYPYFCWNSFNNREILLGSAEKTVFGRITDKLTEMYPTSQKLSELYRIDVKQNVISKRAYDYFANIKKNNQQSGSIFAPVPSELRGNITCETDPARPVIGYIDISTTTHKRMYIKSKDVYEQSFSNCVIQNRDEYCGDDLFCIWPPEFWVPYDERGLLYTYIGCVDCTYYGNTTIKPEDWPNILN